MLIRDNPVIMNICFHLETNAFFFFLTFYISLLYMIHPGVLFCSLFIYIYIQKHSRDQCLMVMNM